MSGKKNRARTVLEKSTLIKSSIKYRAFRIASFSILLFILTVIPASAQTREFDKIGQIRAVISETEAEFPSWKGTSVDPGVKFSGTARSKVDFYFTYAAVEAGSRIEKWIAIAPDGRNWSELSNRPVRLRAGLKENKLLNATATPLNDAPENQITVPPPTVGLYKTVFVPLTIQPPAAGKENVGRKSAALSVTPEAIRNTLFNAPNSVNKFFQQASYGMFGLTGVHHPQVDVVPVTIQATISADCQTQIVDQFTNTVRQRLLEQNINTANGSVDLAVIIFNDTPGCPTYPFATRGALGARGVPQWLWMPESWFVTGPSIVAHELGHCLGNNHPYALRCENFDDPQTCQAAEPNVNDRDIMAYGGSHYLVPNNFERRRWGWHPSGVFDASPAGSSVYMYDLQSSVLPFTKDSSARGRFYFRSLMSGAFFEFDVYPEARRNWGVFERYQAADDSFRLGVAVRIGHRNYSSPEAATALLDHNSTPHLEDAPLRENQQISIGGIIITCVREHNPMWGTRIRVQ